MALIRHIRIQNFRSIYKLDWSPSEGLNCLIGPGDSGKTAILDAIDFCLNPRRYAPISENDFYTLNTDEPILIELTIGSLEDELLKLDSYLNFIRGFDLATKKIQDEPGGTLEPVLTVRLEVADDLLPKWRLYCERTEQNGEIRDLNFKDRNAIGPTRLGSYADSQLAWGQRSILNRLGTERPNAGKALASARKEARGAFISKTGDTFKNVLDIVSEVAGELAVDVGGQVKAILDTSEVAIVNGAVALHDSRDIPLRSLGLGSSRLLVAGLQRRAGHSQITLIDELEHGLEPYRIVQLLHTLGSKASTKIQTFVTTHSPVVVRELSVDQLTIIRKPGGSKKPHRAISAESHILSKKVLRACAEAFLTPRVIVCEGKTEVGFLRGLDLIRHDTGRPTLARCGVFAADGGGSEAVARALTFAELGYEVSLLRDDDVPLTPSALRSLQAKRIPIIQWTEKLAFEAALFKACPSEAIPDLLQIAIDERGRDAIDADIKAVSNNKHDCDSCLANCLNPELPDMLALAATRKHSDGSHRNWFKLIDPAERVGHEVFASYGSKFKPEFLAVVSNLKTWIDRSVSNAPQTGK